MRLRLAGRSLGAASAALITLAPEHAAAVDFEVQADTALQLYQVGDPWGDVMLQRRRFMQTLGLSVYNLQGEYRPGEADYRVVMLMRLDADFGVNAQLPQSQAGGETTWATPAGNGVRFIPGLSEAPLDLMYGYVEGRNIAHGLLGFKLGRQYVSDVLGWWSFDGGLVRITTPFYVQAEVYGGLEQRGGMLFSTSRYERQGIWRGSHSGFGIGAGQPSATDYPSYQYTAPAPAFGFALESAGPSFMHGRLSYRRVYNTGTSLTQQFPDATGGYPTAAGLRISQERIGYALDANKADLGGLRGGFSYDLYNQLVATAYGGLDVYLGERLTIGGDADYYVPTFDADSIWNWFTKGPLTTLTGRASFAVTRRFDISASGGARLWTVEGDPETFGAGECAALGLGSDCVGSATLDPSVVPLKTYVRDEANRSSSTTLDALGNLNARYRFGSGQLSLRGTLQAGSRGSREGVDLSGEKRLNGDRFTLGSRLSLYGWHDPLRPDRDATSFGYVLAAGYKPAQIANLRLEWQHDMNRLVGQRFRVLGLINIMVLK